MEQYDILGRIGEGAHGIVLKAKHVEVSFLSTQNFYSKSGELVALKKVPLRKLVDGIPNTALRLDEHANFLIKFQRNQSTSIYRIQSIRCSTA